MSAHVLRARTDEILAVNIQHLNANTNSLLLGLLLAQWVIAIALAFTVAPQAWAAYPVSVRLCVEIAAGGGLILNALPLLLIRLRPRWWATRHAIAVTQLVCSGFLVQLTAGKIETHMHVFVSLAVLSFYRDWRVLATATATVAIDHVIRALWWPESIFGTVNSAGWRMLEDIGWVLFADCLFFLGCRRWLVDQRLEAGREAKFELSMAGVEQRIAIRTAELKASGDKYRMLIENSSAVPWELDCDNCTTIYVAPQAKSTFGNAAGNSEILDFIALFHPDDRPKLRQFIDKAPGTERIQQIVGSMIDYCQHGDGSLDSEPGIGKIFMLRVPFDAEVNDAATAP